MRHPIVRIAAVASSIVLVGLYIVYRTGGQTASPSLPGSKGGVLQLNTPTTGPTSAPATTLPVPGAEFHVISSSKFAPVFKPGAFSGSKSAAPFHPSDAAVILPSGNALTLQSIAAATTRPLISTQPAATQPAKKP